MVQYDLITSDLFWLLILIAAMIFGGMDGRTRGSLWGGGWGTGWGSGWSGWGMTRQRKPWKSDLEIRQKYKDRMGEEVVTVTAADTIERPDRHLEQLIKSGKFDEAHEYRQEMEKIAEDMDDDRGLRKYAIYGARISRGEKEEKQRERKKLKTETSWLGFMKGPKTGKSDPESLISPPHDSKSSSASPPLWKKQISKTAEIAPAAVEPVSDAAKLPPQVIERKTSAAKTEPAPRKKKERIEPVKPSVPTEKPPVWGREKEEPKPTLPRPSVEPRPPVAPRPSVAPRPTERRIGPEYVPPPPPTPPPSYERPAARAPEKPAPEKPVEIPAGFTPPPPGPVQIGGTQTSSFKPPDKPEKKPVEPAKKESPAVEEEVTIDPDEYTDLIDL